MIGKKEIKNNITFYNISKDKDTEKYNFKQENKIIDANFIQGKVDKIKLVLRKVDKGNKRYLIYVFFNDGENIDCLAINLNQMSRTLLNKVAGPEFDKTKSLSLELSEDKKNYFIKQEDKNIKWLIQQDDINNRIVKAGEIDNVENLKLFYELFKKAGEKVTIEEDIDDDIKKVLSE